MLNIKYYYYLDARTSIDDDINILTNITYKCAVTKFSSDDVENLLTWSENLTL